MYEIIVFRWSLVSTEKLENIQGNYYKSRIPAYQKEQYLANADVILHVFYVWVQCTNSAYCRLKQRCKSFII